jgi:hypothetical protein
MKTQGNNSSLVERCAIYAGPISIFLYVTIRAALIDVTHDEAYSFYNMKKFWYAEALCTGNTHWLNSAAIKMAIIFNLENLLSIRWLSIASALVICVIVWKWIKQTKGFDNQLLIIAVLLCNPYILDYLSIARGYAAGLMLEFVSLFFLAKAVETQNKRTAFFSLLFAGLSPVANFSYIYFFFAFCLIYFFKFYFLQGRFWGRKEFYRDVLFSFAIAALVIRAFLFISNCSNDVIGAGTDNMAEFFHVFADALLYMKWQPALNILSVLGVAMFLFILSAACYGVMQKSLNDSLYFISAAIFLLIIFLLLVNHFAFHLVFPYYRSAVFLFPVSAICTVSFIKVINLRIKLSSYILSILLLLNFIFSANVKWVFDFKIQCNLKESMDYVASLNAQHVGISPELYGGFRNYYQMTWKNYYDFFGKPINTNLPRGRSNDPLFLEKFDHLILFPPYNLSFYRNNKIKLRGLHLFPETGTLIVKVEK